MNRRVFISTLALAVLATPLAAEAQRAGKVYRIGYLGSRNPEATRHVVQAFRQGLRELSWVEGQNIAIEYRFAGTKLERFPDLVAELVRLNVDVIFSTSETGARAAKQATTTIPIVVGAAGDPVGTGLIASLARPGGNVTGFALVTGPEISGKLLQLLKEVVPKVSRVAVLWNPSNPIVPPHWREVQGAAQALRVTLLSVEARAPQDVERAFSAMTSWRAGALLVLLDIFTITHQNQIVDLAARSRLPAMYGFRDSVEAGGLIAYAPSLPDLVRRAAVYVDKILKGANPGDLPIQQPTRFELVINMKTAKALGLTIPQSVLVRADAVIQ